MESFISVMRRKRRKVEIDNGDRKGKHDQEWSDDRSWNNMEVGREKRKGRKTKFGSHRRLKK